MRRTKLTFTTSRPDEASPLVKYPFSWRASSFAGARQMGYYLRKVLFQSQGVIRISSAGRASSTRGGKKRRRRRWRRMVHNEWNKESNELPLPEKLFSASFSFHLLTRDRIPSHRMTIHPYNSAPSVRKDVFGEENKKYIFFFLSPFFFFFSFFQFYFADFTIFQFTRWNICIYIYIYMNFRRDRGMMVLVEDLRLKVRIWELWFGNLWFCFWGM